MVDDVKDITENAESKVSQEALDRSRLARERREAEQRKRLDELRAHAAAAQAQRERRDEERRKRQAEQRARDDDRRLQVEERKRAIWEASVSRREALVQRERERAERLERARAARSAPRPAFAFGSSTPRLLEPVDSAGFFWAARSTNPSDQMNFFESLAASTTNVMYASAPLTRRASALQLDSSDTDNKDEPDRQPPMVWSSVARRRTDLVPTLPAPRAPGRAYSMTRLDKLPPRLGVASASPSMHHLNRSQTRSGETTPGSRPGSAMSNATGVVRRAASTPRKPRPASIAGTGVNTPRGGGDTGANSVATTPSVSRDATTVAGGDAPRRPIPAQRKPRPLSLHASPRPAPPLAPGDGKPPLHRKPKSSKEHDRRGKSQSPGRALSPPPPAPRHAASETPEKPVNQLPDKRQVNAVEVTQKLEALQVEDHTGTPPQAHEKAIENKENVEVKAESKPEQIIVDEHKEEKPIEVQKPVEKKEPSQERKEEKKEPSQERKEEKKEPSQEKTEENEMTASMTARRITTEEEAKAALAERRRRAREELERQAELERQRLQREAEEEAERQRQEEERQRREEEEARELAALQRRVEEEKLRKAIEAQQQLEREEAERKAREEAERKTRAREEEEKRRAAEESERLRREEAEREERERLARKQRVEAIMARTRLKKQAEEDKKQQDNKVQQPVNSALAAPTSAESDATTPATTVNAAPAHTVAAVDATPTLDATPAPLVDVRTGNEAPSAQVTADHVNSNNGNVHTADLLQLATSQPDEARGTSEGVATENQVVQPSEPSTNNGNVTADLLGMSDRTDTKDTAEEQMTKANNQPTVDNTPTLATNNGNVQHTLEPTHVGHVSASFIQNERITAEHNSQTKLAEVPKLLDEDFTTHNGHSATHNHPLTLQNAI